MFYSLWNISWQKKNQTNILLRHRNRSHMQSYAEIDRQLKRDSLALSISCSNLFLSLKQQTCYSGWGWADMKELTNCITGHYRCSVIDYLYHYKMSGSLVDQVCLACSDKMFPFKSPHQGKQHTQIHERAEWQSPASIIDVKLTVSRTRNKDVMIAKAYLCMLLK